MPFQRKYVSLIINGFNYTHEALLAGAWFKNYPSIKKETWQKSLHQFITEWMNEADFVTVQTSGSTGQPKKIKLLKKRMMNSAFMTGKYFNFKSGQKAILCLPCDYIAGKMMVVRALMWGLDLQLVPPKGNPMADIIEPIDFAAMIPLQVANIFEENPDKFSLIKILIIGGGKVDAQLAKKLEMISTQCYATYGMTETITHVAIKKLNGPQQSTHFEALSNISLSTDKRGCLKIDAPKLSENTVVTNDIVDLKHGQQFEWLGRFDNVINTGGIKVFPEKIETILEKIITQRFFITSLPDKKLENKVILIIEDKAWITKKIDTLLLDIKQVLTKFEQPKAIYFVDKFEETPTKKIQRNRTKKKVIKFNL